MATVAAATRPMSHSVSKSPTCPCPRVRREPTAGRRSASRRSICSRAATSTTSAATPTWTWRLPQTPKRRCLHSSKKSAGRRHPSARARSRRAASRSQRRTRRLSSTASETRRHGWDASPVSVPRIIAELGEQIDNDDWAIVSGHQFTGDWQRRLLNHDKPYRYNGDCGGFGIGYDSPASVGGALAHKKFGRLSVAIVGDGDLNFSPGVIWTAAHHKIPLLFIVHNNRAYHAEVMIIQRMCGVRGRGNQNAHIGNVDHRSQHQLRADGQSVWDVQRRTDREPEGSGGSVSAGAGEGEGGRASPDRRHFTAALIATHALRLCSGRPEPSRGARHRGTETFMIARFAFVTLALMAMIIRLPRKRRQPLRLLRSPRQPVTRSVGNAVRDDAALLCLSRFRWSDRIAASRAHDARRRHLPRLRAQTGDTGHAVLCGSARG